MLKTQISPLAASIIAFLVAVIFMMVFVFVDSFYGRLSYNFFGTIQAHVRNPAMWLIYLLPLWSALIVYKIFKFINFLLDNIDQLRKQKIDESKRISRFVSTIEDDEPIESCDLDIEKNELHRSLFELKRKIRQNTLEEIARKTEDEQRRWFSEGLAKFGEILRQNQNDLHEISYQFISNLVKYINANQGGVFILNDDVENNKHFELTACYAYDRRKFFERKINFEEGLVGACALEKQTIFLKEIPDSYLNITSGLGKANPQILLLVPLNINGENHGVLEIASFRIFRPFEIEFIEKLSESFASTIAGAKINLRTVKLLNQSREQAEMLISHKGEMQQNLMELQATQEEATRQSEKYRSFSDSVNQTLIRAEYDTNGLLLYANNKFLSMLGYSDIKEIEGQKIDIFINPKDREWFGPIWRNLSTGGKLFEGYMKHVTKFGQDIWTMAAYTGVIDSKGKIEKILFLAIDTTDQKKQSLDYEGQIAALDLSNLKAELSLDGSLIHINELFLQTLKCNKEHIQCKTIFDFIHKEELDSFNLLWESILSGDSFIGQLKICDSINNEIWLRGTLSVVKNMYGEISKIVLIAIDITKEKQIEFEKNKQTELLKEQEAKLRNSDIELRAKLKEAREEMKLQFAETEKIKILNEKTLEGALDAIVTINKQGKIEFFNKAAEDLWGFKKKDILRQNVSNLFSITQIENDDFIKSFIDPNLDKIIGKRQEVSITDKSGKEKQVLFLLSEAIVGDEHTFTAFIQNIEVELF